MPPVPPPKRSWIRRALPLIGIALLAYVVSRLDAAAMRAAFNKASATDLLLACGVFGINLWLKAWRWQRMLYWQGIPLPARVALAAFFSGQFYGQVTVGRVGELMRAEALTATGVTTGRALSACLIDRVIDLSLVAGTATILSALLLADATGALVASVVLIGLTVAGLLVLQAVAQRHEQQALGAFSRRPAIRRALDFLVELIRGARPLLRPAAFAESLMWTALAWTGYFATLWILADGIGATADRSLLTAASALAALSSLLPITVSGLGAREAIFAQVMHTQGVPNESAVVLALLNLAVMMLTTLVLGGGGLIARQRQLARI